MRVAVIGLGKLGSPMAAVFASRGHDVMGCDLDESKVLLLGSGEAPVVETDLQSLLDSLPTSIHTTTSIEEAAQNAEIVFVIVPTPSTPDGSFSLEYVRNVMFSLAPLQLHGLSQYQVINIVSTVSPGSMVDLHDIFDASCGAPCGTTWGLAYNPEFIALGSVIRDLLRPDFVLIGQSDKRAGDAVEQFYRTLHNAPIRRMSFASAEIAKLGLNVALTQRISYANTISELCEYVPGAIASDVLDAIGTDKRIGRRYMASGTGYGGPCFPRDCRAFQAAAIKVDSQAWMAAATDAVNNQQAERLANIVEREANEGDVIGILGLTYKTDTDVTEESAGLALLAELERRGRKVLTYDPRATGTESSLAVIADKSCVLIVTTPWPELVERLPGILQSYNRPSVLIDCWGQFTDLPLSNQMKVITLGKS